MVQLLDYTLQETLFSVVLEFRDLSTALMFKPSDVPAKYKKNFDFFDEVKTHRLCLTEKERYRRVLVIKPECVKDRILSNELLAIVP